jgi:hypothetical protein
MNSIEFIFIIAIVFILGVISGFLLKDTVKRLKFIYDRFLFRPKVLKPLTAKNRSSFEPEHHEENSH